MSDKPEVKAVVCKMRCSVLETTNYGPGCAPQLKVKLGAIYGTEGENKDFADATPSGECWMNINAGRPAAEFFDPQSDYYVTFTKVPKTA
jgi:hypothetical protein